MLTVYLGSPRTQQQAHSANGMPVLLSYPLYSKWMDGYLASYDRVLVDSGAFSELNSGVSVDLDGYAEFSKSMLSVPHVDACACLDDIRGDWRRGLRNWESMPWTFPVFHDSDPPEALEAILERVFDDGRPRWIGLGMVPPRRSADWLDQTLSTLEKRAPGLHVHGFALRGHLDRLLKHRGRSVSVDSVNWILDVRKILDSPLTRHLTPAEALDIIVKRYRRDGRQPISTNQQQRQTEMF